MGFEIFVHPDVMGTLWEQLMEVGAPFGLRPIGLGARDSLRIEAGLPLYGHELAGPLHLRPDDAGFAGYVKLHKPFFVGRRAYIEHAQQRKTTVARFRIAEKGVRIPKQEDVVTERHCHQEWSPVHNSQRHRGRLRRGSGALLGTRGRRQRPGNCRQRHLLVADDAAERAGWPGAGRDLV